MEALERFDPSGGRTFETYAEFRVKGAILDELRRADPLNRSARTAHNRVAAKTAELTSEFGRPPGSDELAAALHTSVDNFVSRLSPLHAYRQVPIDPEAVPAEDGSADQEERLGQKELQALVRRAIETLSSREQMVLNLYYVDEVNQAQIGKMLGVSESRICQILTETVKTLRRQIARELD